MTRLRMDFVRHVRHANINAGIIVDTILPVQLRGHPVRRRHNYASADFVMGNCRFFADNVDPEFLSNCEAGDGWSE
jgi:hypothetical protein